MSSLERACATCGATDETVRLERCGVCAGFFCADHFHRALGGRRLCSETCARNYYFHGETDDDEDEAVRDDD